MDKEQFFYPRYHYSDKLHPENLVLNASLLKFSQRVGYISALETAGKISPAQAYKNIKFYWQELKRSLKQLRIDDSHSG